LTNYIKQIFLQQRKLMRVWKRSWLYKRWGSTLCPSWHTQTQNDLMPCCKTCFLESSSEILSTRRWEAHWKKSVLSLIWQSSIVRFDIELITSVLCFLRTAIIVSRQLIVLQISMTITTLVAGCTQ